MDLFQRDDLPTKKPFAEEEKVKQSYFHKKKYLYKILLLLFYSRF